MADMGKDDGALDTENQEQTETVNESVDNQQTDSSATEQQPEEVTDEQATEPVQTDQGFFTSDVPAPSTEDGTQEHVEPVNWTASEFVAHQKSAVWYIRLGAVAAVVAAAIYLLTRDIISTSVVIIGAIVLGAYGARQPRQLEYKVDARGVNIGQKYYSYDVFRSFSVVPEGAFSSIVFMPLKRFSPLTIIYYAPEDESKIVAILSSRLPLQDYTHDPVERLMHHIRF